jgi:hypothetical protein
LDKTYLAAPIKPDLPRLAGVESAGKRSNSNAHRLRCFSTGRHFR